MSPPPHPLGIMEYMKRQAGPSSVFMGDVQEVRKFISSDHTHAVGFFSKETSTLLVEAFIESGNFVWEIMQLGYVTNGDIAKGMGM